MSASGEWGRPLANSFANPFERSRYLGSVSLVSPAIVRVNLPFATEVAPSQYAGHRVTRGQVGEFVVIESYAAAVIGRIVEIQLPDRDRLSVEPERKEGDEVANPQAPFAFPSMRPRGGVQHRRSVRGEIPSHEHTETAEVRGTRLDPHDWGCADHSPPQAKCKTPESKRRAAALTMNSFSVMWGSRWGSSCLTMANSIKNNDLCRLTGGESGSQIHYLRSFNFEHLRLPLNAHFLLSEIQAVCMCHKTARQL